MRQHSLMGVFTLSFLLLVVKFISNHLLLLSTMAYCKQHIEFSTLYMTTTLTPSSNWCCNTSQYLTKTLAAKVLILFRRPTIHCHNIVYTSYDYSSCNRLIWILRTSQFSFQNIGSKSLNPSQPLSQHHFDPTTTTLTIHELIMTRQERLVFFSKGYSCCMKRDSIGQRRKNIIVVRQLRTPTIVLEGHGLLA